MTDTSIDSDAVGADVQRVLPLPDGWVMCPIKEVASLTTGGTPDSANDEYWGDGDGTPWIAIGDMGSLGGRPNTQRWLTAAGLTAARLRVSSTPTVLFAMYASVGETAFLNWQATWNQAILGLTPTSDISARFLYWSVSSMKPVLPYFYRSNTQNNLNAQQVANFRLAFPNLDKQKEIADFLDRETSEIDAFITDQEELMGLLAERRATTISHAVTKGLDPSAPMKNSGVEWLGEIPAHWTATRTSRFFRVTLGKMLDAGKVLGPDSILLPYIRAANIQEAGLDLRCVNEMQFTVSECRSLDIRRGDLLVVEGGAVGVNVHITEDMTGWSFQKTVNRMRSTSSEVLPRFLGFAIDALRWSGVIDMLSNKSTIAHLTAEKLERMVVAFPPKAEQEAIVTQLEHETREIDETIADAREAIALSRERRAALISAAVTGKIDVRNHGEVA